MILALTISLFPSSGIEPNNEKRSKDSKKNAKDNGSKKKNEDESFFKAVGNEPFWNISISKKGIIYSANKADETIVFPYVDAIQVGETKVYKTHTKREEIEIVIYEELTSDIFTGYEYDHSIAVHLKRNIHSNEVASDFAGYGYYIFDPNLSGSWILQSFEDKKIEDLNIDQIPLINIDVSTKSFSGSGGNHIIYGDLACEGDSIQFKNIMAPEKASEEFLKERELLSVLEHSNKFKLKEDELQLFIDHERKMVFRRDTYVYL
ncbi:META domain-containing protein [Flavobacterium sp. NKUCC04_CG]|uniref:META domain-containing protein n=1 Tax=Flavobacterium sp. NKUCC04_CG TaxID=2842121 RepID=UPI001C5BEA2F|nr:META domain-containing protein [Flavobacterium sp. NKUCC04_CG]MBW3519738.1 META domain-containing protein [Flavobacterium sp. NKUCC04_CG]